MARESNAMGTGSLTGALAPGPLRVAGGALLGWSSALALEAASVAAMWWVGLWLLQVPVAPLWALVAAFCKLIPIFGGALSVLGPVFTVLVSGHDLGRLGLVLGLYAVIVIVDQLLIQPLLLRRITRVPVWASVLVPILLGVVIPFWGVLLAPPLLAVVYAFGRPRPGVTAC